MIFVHRLLLIFMVWFLFVIPSLSAEVLPLPKLSDVMKENEKLQRVQIRKNRIAKIPMLASTEILAYHTLESGNAITLSKYDTIDLWVQEIDLAKWGRMESLLTLGGYDELTGEPLFEKKKLSEIGSSIANRPFSIFNGQFFDPKRSLTPLSFWLKVDGIVRTAGADNRNETKNIFVLDIKSAKIIPYSWENLRDASGYMAMVNLSLDTTHYKDESIGRTYICLKNPNTKNESSKVLIFTAVSMLESAIENELIRWGCTHPSSTKLDSSGSTRLWANGIDIFGNTHNGTPDYRKIPHSIVV